MKQIIKSFEEKAKFAKMTLEMTLEKGVAGIKEKIEENKKRPEGEKDKTLEVVGQVYDQALKLREELVKDDIKSTVKATAQRAKLEIERLQQAAKQIKKEEVIGTAKLLGQIAEAKLSDWLKKPKTESETARSVETTQTIEVKSVTPAGTRSSLSDGLRRPIKATVVKAKRTNAKAQDHRTGKNGANT